MLPERLPDGGFQQRGSSVSLQSWSGRALNRLLSAACLGLSLAAPAYALPSTEASPQAASAFHIIALGSSSTQGTGASSAIMSYPAQLERLFGDRFHGHPAVTVTNRGIAGEDIDDMEKRLDTDVLSRHPDLVIWQAGSNDPLRGVPMDRFKTELRDGIAAIRATGAEVVLMEPQWSPVIERADAKSRFVDAVRDIAAAEHVDVIRRYALMKGWIDDGLVSPQQLVGPDNLHMTDQGYALLAKAVMAQISAGSRAFHKCQSATASGRP